MSYAKGIVDAISIKDRKSGQHGDFANYGIKLKTPNGEEWFNGVCNADKNTNQLVVKDKNFNEVTIGMEVEFMTQPDKQGYEKIDRKTFTALSGSKQPTQQPTVKPTPQQPTQQCGVTMQQLLEEILTNRAMLAALIAFHGKEMPKEIDDLLARKAKSLIDQA